MKIDELIEKTTGNDVIIKWKVVVGIILGLLLAICIVFSIWVICDVDTYIHDNNQIVALYDFYDTHDYTNETSVYFVGNSQLGYAIYTPEINKILGESGYNITTYNLFLDDETPNDLLLQLERIINHHPDLVIIGYSYRNLLYSEFYTARSSLISHRVNLTIDLNGYLSENEISSLGTGKRIDVYRSSIVDAIIGRFSSPSIKQTYDYESDPIGVEYRKLWNNLDLISVSKILDRWPGAPVVTDELILEQKSIVYFIDSLTNAGINVVVISVPIHPFYSEKISESSKETFHIFLDSLEVDWYNYEDKYDTSFFRDNGHANWNGSLVFSQEMTNLIIQELS